MGINFGGLIGPLITGWLQVTWGFHLDFGAAAAGMALGLLQYALTRKNLPASAHRVPNPLPAKNLGKAAALAATAVVLIAAAVALKLITAGNLKWIIVGVVIVAAIAYFAAILANKSLTGAERSRVYSFMPPSWVTSINPVFIIVLAGVFAAGWTKWGAPSPARR